MCVLRALSVGIAPMPAPGVYVHWSDDFAGTRPDTSNNHTTLRLPEATPKLNPGGWERHYDDS